MADVLGEWVGPDEDETSQYLVTRVVIHRQGSFAAASYRPAEPILSSGIVGSYRDLWSPDGEYAALLQGRFDGVLVLEAKTLLTGELSSERVADAIAVRYHGKPRSLWHEFRGWSADHLLLFDITIDNSRVAFAYDPGRKSLSSSSAAIPALDAVNAAGPVPIAWGR